jgi:hypothetical protein
MQSRQYPKHYIEHLEQQLHELRAQAQVLAEQQQSLRVEHSIVSACCEVLHSMRTGAVHRRWRCLRKKRAAAGFLPQELPLLLDLGFQLDLSQLPELQQVVADHQQQRQQQQSCARYTRSRAAAGQTALPRASIQQRLADDDSSGLPWQNQQQQQQPGSRGKSAAKAEAAAPRQQLFLVPGECLGPLRYALSQPPYPGASMSSVCLSGTHARGADACTPRPCRRHAIATAAAHARWRLWVTEGLSHQSPPPFRHCVSVCSVRPLLLPCVPTHTPSLHFFE